MGGNGAVMWVVMGVVMEVVMLVAMGAVMLRCHISDNFHDLLAHPLK